MVRRWTAAGFVLLACLAVGLAQAAAGSSPGVTPCALGAASKAEARVEASVLRAARARFERSLATTSPSARASAGALYTTDLAAFIYGFPIVIQRLTIDSYPRNTMVAVGQLADTNQRSIVAPNHDTLYSVARIDLSGGPIVIATPPTGGRYSVIQLIDGFTNATAYLGDGAAARTGEAAVLVPRGFHGALPSGLRVIRPATNLVLLLGRTLAADRTDTAGAVALLRRYSVTPLSAYTAGARNSPLILARFPKRAPIRVPTGTAFFDALLGDLTADPPPPADRCAIGAFLSAGAYVVPAFHPPPTHAMVRALQTAAADGPAVLRSLVAGLQHAAARLRNGWASTPADTAEFGVHYADRALVARIGLEANTNAKALYLAQHDDSAGHPLDGSHVYRVRFARGQLPPVSAFWSLTLYNAQLEFYGNPLNRYTIGDRSPGLRRDAGGGLTIIVSHRAPRASERANWLPAPAGSFSLYLRLYQPKRPAVTGRWMPPAVVRR